MKWLLLSASFLILRVAAPASEPAPPAPERLEWFRQARYGLFIHWGLYSVPAGSFQGKHIDRGEYGNGLGEWIMYNAKIPVAEYARFAEKFNPVNFDAEAWATLAEAAGMKYIVITSKHHDGFAMFKTAASPYNIVEATPFHRDPLKELAAACARHGLRFGVYYSQAQDWHHPGGAAYPGGGSSGFSGGDPGKGHWDRAQDGNFDAYLDRIAIPQVRELLSNYGPISVLWWDTPVGMTPARAARLAQLLPLQPGIITNNRLLNPRAPNAYSGDTETPEQFIPATGANGRLFEVCMTMNETWGYKAHDQNWKPAADITRKLIEIASKGGNFLLNVGPNSLGEIPAASVERLRASGAWVHANAEAIYGTSASQFRQLPWGRSTTRGSTLYLHVFDWPADGRLQVPGLKSAVASATFLVSGKALPTKMTGDGVEVTVPLVAPDPVATVIRLSFRQPPVIQQALPGPDATGAIVLPAAVASVVTAYGANARLMQGSEGNYIGSWDRAGTTLSWEFAVTQPGRYALEVEAAATGPAELAVTAGETKVTSVLPGTGKRAPYQTFRLTTVTLAKAGDQQLELKSGGTAWPDVRLKSVRLIPLP